MAEAVIPAVRGIHDPALFVSPKKLRAECARHGVPLEVRGVRPGEEVVTTGSFALKSELLKDRIGGEE